MDEIRLSISAINKYNQCPRKYKHVYVDGVREEFKTDALDIGTLVHLGIQRALQAHDSGNVLQAAINGLDFHKGLYPDAYEKAIELLTYYVPLLGIGTAIYPVLVNNAPLLEHRFELRAGNAVFSGVIDAVLVTPDGKILLADWKTRRKLYDEAVINNDSQLYLYAYALQTELGLTADAVYQIQMSTALPGVPKRNKNGTVSKVLSKTTWDIFSKTVMEWGYDPMELKEQHEDKIVDQSEFIRWTPVDLSRMDMVLNNLALNTKRVLEDNTYPMVLNTYQCGGCYFSDVCAGKKTIDEMR